MGQAVIILVAVVVGLAIGAFVGRILAREGARSEFDKRNADAERRALTAEAAVPELRAQLKQKDFDTDELRRRLDSEMTARATAEAALLAGKRQLEEERALLAQAQDKLKETFQAVAAPDKGGRLPFYGNRPQLI